MYLVGLHIYYKMIHGPYNVEYRDLHVFFDVTWCSLVEIYRTGETYCLHLHNPSQP